jgi:hypothetical protein
VATAAIPGNSSAAASAAAPPRLCPISKAGGIPASIIAFVAATRSAISLLKPASAKSPPLCPRPVKSNRSTAMPRSAKARLIRTAASDSLVQVKQWAKRA